MRVLKAIGPIIVLILLTGCAAFTPYESDFTCPKTFNGKCVSTTTAYEESLEGTKGNDPEDDGLQKGSSDDSDALDAEEGSSHSKLPNPEHSYFSALINKLTGILKEPKTPVIAPPQILRVLILPYQGENAELYMPRYIYLIVDEAQWVLGNQLSEQGPWKEQSKTGQHTFPLR